MKINEVSLKPASDGSEGKTLLKIIPIPAQREPLMSEARSMLVRAAMWPRTDPDFHLGHVGAE